MKLFLNEYKMSDLSEKKLFNKISDMDVPERNYYIDALPVLKKINPLNPN